jgi:hypothetical protein
VVHGRATEWLYGLYLAAWVTHAQASKRAAIARDALPAPAAGRRAMNLSIPLIPTWVKAVAIGAGLAFITYQVHQHGVESGAAAQHKTDEKVRIGLVADYEKQLGKFKDQRNAELATACATSSPGAAGQPGRYPCWRPVPNWSVPSSN